MIDRIVIDNFKSIKHADVKLQKINVLIGPNNAGKSNFLKGILHAKNSIRVSENRFYVDYSFSLEDDNKDNRKTDFEFFIDGEFLAITKFEIEEADDSSPFVRNANADSIKKLYDLTKQTKVYKPDLAKLHLPYPVFQNDDSVLEDASNIASFLQTCLNKHRKYFNLITEELKKVLPIFDEIIIENVIEEVEEEKNIKGKTKPVETLQPKIKIGFRDFQDRIIWAEDLSEGALYYVALLCIIHQPNPPKLLMLEEPERGIHPRRIKDVIDLIRTLSEEKDIQVIFTTHSPLVVDLFEDEPESIFVFEMKDGFTEIKNLQTDINEPLNKELEAQGIEPNKDYGTSLGEKWVFGFLGGVPV